MSSAPIPTESNLFALASPDPDESGGLEHHRRLADRLLARAGGEGAFALFRFTGEERLEAIQFRGWPEPVVEELGQALSQALGDPAGGEPWSATIAAALEAIGSTMGDRAHPGPVRGVILGPDSAPLGVLVHAGENALDDGELGPAILAVMGHALATHQEVLETRRRDEFLRAIIRDVSTGLIAIDPLGRVIFLNAAAEQVLGVAAGDALGADATRVFRTMVEGENVLLQGLSGDMPPMEIWLRRRDGRELPVELRLSRIRSRAGQVLGVVAAFQDFSEVRSMQERLRHRDRLATIGELAAGIAHEIRNPLTGIRGCAQILRDRLGTGSESLPLVDVIMEEVDRLSRLSEQVRHYVRPQQPSMQLAPMGAVLDRVEALVTPDAQEHGVSIYRDDEAELPDLWHDPDQIQQVVLNLARNGVESMRGSGGRLELVARLERRAVAGSDRRARRVEDRPRPVPRQRERDFIRVRVSDTGPGIPADELDRIFNPFFTTKPDGLGLGLSISQTIVGEHAGFISVVSREGKGTTFILDLPVDRRAP